MNEQIDLKGILALITAHYQDVTMSWIRISRIKYKLNLVVKTEESPLILNSFWTKTEKGGYHHYELDPEFFGYYLVGEYAKKINLSRQRIHEKKEIYSWINISKNKNLIKRLNAKEISTIST